MRRAAVAAFLVALLFVGIPLTPPAARPAAAGSAQIDGQTYVSPTFGYRLAWDDSWLVTDVVTEAETDTLVLSNGLAFVQFTASPGFGGSAAACVADYEAALAFRAGAGNVEPVTDGGGAEVAADDASARAAFSYTLDFEDGGAIDIVDEVECRTLLGGAAMLQIVASTELVDYGAVQPAIEELKAGLALPSPGEPGPAFVSGRWRVAVAAAVRAPAVDTVRLRASDEREWVVVVADVTNWGDEEATFAPEEAALSLDDGARRAKLARRSTDAVARRLDIAPADPGSGVAIDPDETARVALVFRVAAAATGPALVLGEEHLPLADALAAGVDLEGLPAVVGPPELVEADVERVRDGGRLDVTLADGSEQRVRLIGVEAPTGAECYAEEAARRLDDLAGKRVWLERETPGDDDAERYVWVEGDEGTRALINHDLVAGGYTGAVDGEDGRFRAWLTAAGMGAQTEGFGLWSACTGLHGDDVPADDATPAAST